MNQATGPLFDKAFSFILSFWRSSILTLIGGFCLLGLVMTLFVPPFQVPDEPAHWLAGYGRTVPKVLSEGPNQHCSIANALPDAFEPGRIAFRFGEKVEGRNFTAVANLKETCADHSLSYGMIGTYPGILVARLLTTGESEFPHKTFQVFILGRVCQGALLVFLVMRLFIVSQATHRLLPGMLTMVAGMLSPLFLQQSFAISADGLTFAVVLSLLFFLFFMKEAKWFDWAVLLFVAGTVGGTKPPLFAPIPVFLIAGLFRAHRESGRQSTLPALRWTPTMLVLITVLASLACAIWVVSKGHNVPAGQYLGRDLSLSRQLTHTMESPMRVFKMVKRTVKGFLTFDLLTGPLGWLDTPISGWTKVRFWQILIVAMVADLVFGVFLFGDSLRRKFSIKRWTVNVVWSSVLVLSLIGAAYLVALVLYLTWSPVGARNIDGLQGRYFLPMLLALPLVVGTLFTGGSCSIEGNYAPQKVASLGGGVVFGYLVALLLCPLYLDLVYRWW